MSGIRHTASFIGAVSVVLLGCKQETKKVTPELFHFPQTANGVVEEAVPVLEFDSTTFHFGTIAEGEKVVHGFVFKNAGDAPLVISQVEPSCGCTTLRDWPRSPIMPGEQGTITIEFNSSGRPGPTNKSIYVQANTVPATTMLYVKGDVAGPDAGTKEKSTPIFAPADI